VIFLHGVLKETAVIAAAGCLAILGPPHDRDITEEMKKRILVT
jgi:hypothetical protein